MDRIQACGACDPGSNPGGSTMGFLEKALSFIRFTHAAHKVERVARVPGEERYATMVEHSWQLALLAWYLIETKKLPLDKEKVLMYALAHDLVETYAGDTYFYDENAQETKQDREREAAEYIRDEFPDFKELHKAIQCYEQRGDDESKFIYALDKVIDPLNIYLEDGLLWREKGVTLQMLIEKKKEKVAVSKPVQALFDDLFEKLEKEQTRLFGGND